MLKIETIICSETSETTRPTIQFLIPEAWNSQQRHCLSPCRQNLTAHIQVDLKMSVGIESSWGNLLLRLLTGVSITAHNFRAIRPTRQYRFSFEYDIDEPAAVILCVSWVRIFSTWICGFNCLILLFNAREWRVADSHLGQNVCRNRSDCLSRSEHVAEGSVWIVPVLRSWCSLQLPEIRRFVWYGCGCADRC